MNIELLHREIQEFINLNLNANISDLLLSGVPFKHIDSKLIIQQIEAKKRTEKKLPKWFHTETIYYPNKLNIEQTSSEITAKYKANLVSGSALMDLTGGFGVDAFYFSKQVEQVTHCEIDSELSEIVKHNYKALKVLNIKCINANGIDELKQIDQPFDWIYIDPSRRDDTNQKVFLLSDCSPNIKTFQGLFLKYTKNVMIKTSPLLDISATLLNLNHVKEVHIVAVNNEVKELLWILERGYDDDVFMKTINIQKKTNQNFKFIFEEEPTAKVDYSVPSSYLYEPNASILKSGAFNSVSTILNTSKLHKHSHLYTSEKLIEFPGRIFKVEKSIPFNKKQFAKEKIDKANITTRNFPLSVHNLRKKLKIKDGGSKYLFFTTDITNTKIILICSKIKLE